ncbi:hypothetical protein FEF09_29865 [Chitinophaga pinensis]|uniref:Uncharacterized protein n=1 Tax=Chitinophaga pinensis TaxID=79329 RepID=A0A5C6LJ68_9BACT|nr:hypothetical protein FEF09_29865 [Chitinophaga pinensis]
MAQHQQYRPCPGTDVPRQAYGADKIWIVNVGDLKPMEFPISFFWTMHGIQKLWNEDNLRDYYTQWAAEHLATRRQRDREILRLYGQYAARRKPELLDANTYSLDAYNEAARVLHEWEALLAATEKVYATMPPAYKCLLRIAATSCKSIHHHSSAVLCCGDEQKAGSCKRLRRQRLG